MISAADDFPKNIEGGFVLSDGDRRLVDDIPASARGTM
jgi:hypothetical protein